MDWHLLLRNANDAQAAVDTAEGALGEVHTLIATYERDSCICR